MGSFHYFENVSFLFGYKTCVDPSKITSSMYMKVIKWDFLFRNNPKNLDPTYTTNLEFLDCFERENPSCNRRNKVSVKRHKENGKQ